jgi:hypothetical protein
MRIIINSINALFAFESHRREKAGHARLQLLEVRMNEKSGARLPCFSTICFGIIRFGTIRFGPFGG